MNRPLALFVGWAGFTSVLLLAAAWIHAGGFMSDAVIGLWARSIVEIDGPIVFDSSQTFYPPIPYFMTVAAQRLLEPDGVPAPLLVSCAVGGALGMIWWYNLVERANFGPVAGLLCTLLLLLNPVFLFAVVAGPGDIFLIAGVWLFGRGLVNLRLSGTAPDLMKAAIGLLILAFSHRYGLLIVLASMPFTVLAGRPSLLKASTSGYLVALFFPLVFAVGSYAFVSWIFESNFIETLLATKLGRRFSLDQSMVVIGATLITGPLVVLSLMRFSTQQAIFMPAMAVALTICASVALDSGLHVSSNPALAVAPILGAVMLAIRFWPAERVRGILVAPMLAAGVAGGWHTVDAAGGAESRSLRHAMLQELGEDPFARHRIAARFLDGHEGVMLDPEANPGIVVLLGGASDLILPGSEAFETTMMTHRLAAPVVAVRPVEHLPYQPDRILRVFPSLAIETPVGYALAHSSHGWRIFTRIAEDTDFEVSYAHSRSR